MHAVRRGDHGRRAARRSARPRWSSPAAPSTARCSGSCWSRWPGRRAPSCCWRPWCCCAPRRWSPARWTGSSTRPWRSLPATAAGGCTRPDPTTELGRMAAAFDTTIDALDRALTEAEQAETAQPPVPRRRRPPAAHAAGGPAGLRGDPAGAPRRAGPAAAGSATSRARRRACRDWSTGCCASPVSTAASSPSGDRPTSSRSPGARWSASGRSRPSWRSSVAVAEDVPTVACDPEAVRDALANVLDNARRFARSRVEVDIDLQRRDRCELVGP